ncbi:oligosaccharide flippase family protein, partial [Candidatus Uhrbacteria bacterium]|nr:oligosaccharide flippase family protein [Candidatus Uhrbacteria bacterium]MBD3284004.1 oligosaccharide flippase family protein [Candidatus Uhrbacteria bacterium]
MKLPYQKRLADQLTKTLRLDVRFYGRAMSWYSISHASALLRGIATTWLMALLLPVEVFGQFRYLLALFGLAGIFSWSGMNNAVIRGIAKGDTIIARAALKKILTVAPYGSIGLLLMALNRWAIGQIEIALGLVVAAIAFPIFSVSSIYSNILTAQEKLKTLAIINTTINLIVAVAFLVGILITKQLFILTLIYFGIEA